MLGLDGQVLRTIIHAGIGAEIEANLDAIGSAGRRDHLGAEILRHLHTRAAEPAGRAHHQHPFAGLQLGAVA